MARPTVCGLAEDDLTSVLRELRARRLLRTGTSEHAELEHPLLAEAVGGGDGSTGGAILLAVIAELPIPADGARRSDRAVDHVLRGRLHVVPQLVAVGVLESGLVDGDAHRAQPGVARRAVDLEADVSRGQPRFTP